MSRLRTTMAVIGLVGVCAIGTACGDDDDDDGSAATTAAGAAVTSVASAPTTASGAGTTAAAGATTGGASAGAVTISISDFTFPESTTVAAGATITITNEDGEEHSFTADDGSSFDTDIEAGESGEVTAPSTPGTYTYHCKYHPSMKATLVVE